MARARPLLRLALAAIIVGAAVTGAAILHHHRVLHVYGCPDGPGIYHCLIAARLVRPGWVDPVAVGILVVGLAVATAVAVRRLRRLIGAALILGAAVTGAVLLSGHRVVGAEYACPHTAGSPCFEQPRPVWAVPTMAGIVVLGLAGAAGVFLTTRSRNSWGPASLS